MRYRVYNDELFHHGILGQKWGVRRFQNPDGTLTPAGRKRYQKFVNKHANKGTSRVELGLTDERTIPAGTKMYRTTSDEQDKLSKGSGVYVTYTDADRHHYKGGTIRAFSGSDKAYEHTYTVTKDLKIPSREKHAEAINTVLEKHPEYVRDAAEAYIQQIYNKKKLSEMPKEKYKQGVDELVRAYDTMPKEIRAFRVAQGFGLADKVRTETIKELSKSGYNAMADEASIGGRYGYGKNAYDTLIVFEKDSLNETSNELISRKSEAKSNAKDWEWVIKVNKQKGKAW